MSKKNIELLVTVEFDDESVLRDLRSIGPKVREKSAKTSMKELSEQLYKLAKEVLKERDA